MPYAVRVRIVGACATSSNSFDRSHGRLGLVGRHERTSASVNRTNICSIFDVDRDRMLKLCL